MAKTTADPGLTVRIISPFETFYDGPAVSLTATNDTGQFDVLLNHTKFFSVLKEGTVQVNTGTEQVDVPIERGILKVNNNTVTLFANV